MHRHRERGYSLYELLLSLGLLGIVFGLTLPSFSDLIADKRLRTAADALFHAAHLARQQSITARRVITLCPSVDGETCDAAGRWGQGFILFANTSRASEGSREPEETVIYRYLTENSVTIEANREYFAFRATERRATNGTFRICDPAGRARSRALVISYTGRPRVAYQDVRGQSYSCSEIS